MIAAKRGQNNPNSNYSVQGSGNWGGGGYQGCNSSRGKGKWRGGKGGWTSSSAPDPPETSRPVEETDKKKSSYSGSNLSN